MAQTDVLWEMVRDLEKPGDKAGEEQSNSQQAGSPSEQTKSGEKSEKTAREGNSEGEKQGKQNSGGRSSESNGHGEDKEEGELSDEDEGEKNDTKSREGNEKEVDKRDESKILAEAKDAIDGLNVSLHIDETGAMDAGGSHGNGADEILDKGYDDLNNRNERADDNKDIDHKENSKDEEEDMDTIEAEETKTPNVNETKETNAADEKEDENTEEGDLPLPPWSTASDPGAEGRRMSDDNLMAEIRACVDSVLDRMEVETSLPKEPSRLERAITEQLKTLREGAISPVSYCSDAEFFENDAFSRSFQNSEELDGRGAVSPVSDCSDIDVSFIRYHFQKDAELKRASRPHKSFVNRKPEREVSPDSYCSDETLKPATRKRKVKVSRSRLKQSGHGYFGVVLRKFDKPVIIKSTGRFKCFYCKRRFLNEKIVQRHEKFHTRGEIIMCEICDMGFVDQFYASHMNDFHGIKSKAILNLDLPDLTRIKTPGEVYARETASASDDECPRCHKFVPHDNLEDHIKEVHGNTQLCPVCYGQYSRLRLHFSLQHARHRYKDYFPDDNDHGEELAPVMTPVTLAKVKRENVRRKSPGVPLVPCPVCGREFKRMATHFKQSHRSLNWRDYENKVKKKKKKLVEEMKEEIKDGEEKREEEEEDEEEKEEEMDDELDDEEEEHEIDGELADDEGMEEEIQRNEDMDEEDEEEDIVEDEEEAEEEEPRPAKKKPALKVKVSLKRLSPVDVDESEESDGSVRIRSKPREKPRRKPGPKSQKRHVSSDESEIESRRPKRKIVPPKRHRSDSDEECSDKPAKVRGRTKRTSSTKQITAPESSDSDEVESAPAPKLEKRKVSKPSEKSKDSEKATMSEEENESDSEEDKGPRKVRVTKRHPRKRKVSLPKFGGSDDEITKDDSDDVVNNDDNDDDDDDDSVKSSSSSRRRLSTMRDEEPARGKNVKSKVEPAKEIRPSPAIKPTDTQCDICFSWYKNIGLHKRLMHKDKSEKNSGSVTSTKSDEAKSPNARKVGSPEPATPDRKRKRSPEVVKESPTEKKKKRKIGPRSVMNKLKEKERMNTSNDQSDDDDLPELHSEKTSPSTSRSDPSPVASKKTSPAAPPGPVRSAGKRVPERCRICKGMYSMLSVHFGRAHPMEPIYLDEKKGKKKSEHVLDEESDIPEEEKDDIEGVDSPLSDEEEELTFPCDKCTSVFGDEKSLKLHQRGMHSNLTCCPICRNKPLGSLPKHFEKCSQGSDGISSILNIVKTSGSVSTKSPKKPECKVCHRTFRQTFQLKEHMQTHESDNLHVCDICDKRFKNPLNLYTHKVQDHDFRSGQDKKPVRKLMGPKSARKKHESGASSVTGSEASSLDRESTKNDFSLSCEVCGKSFPTKKKLENHLLVHTGEHPYECDNCGQSFREKRYLTTHHRGGYCK